MKEKLLVTFVLAALLAATSVSAQTPTLTSASTSIDSVILTTKTSYPDTIIAGAVANKIGAPVFVTSQGKLDSDVLSEIGNLNPSTVYIVGGTAAISEDVENTLSQDYDVVRIWGVTRYGTAAELANYFWESSDKVILVWDVLGLADAGNYEMLSDVRDLAIQEDMPVLLIQKNEIPEQVVDTMVNLSVESVILVGNVGSGVTDTLDDLGITVDEEIKGADASATREKIRTMVKDEIRSRAERPFVVVAAGNWSDSIKAPYLTNGTARHITSEDQIDDLIDEINDMNYTSIKIVGNPELAQTIHDRLAEAGIDADLVSARNVVAAAVALMKKDLAMIRVRAAAVKATLTNMYRTRVMSLEGDMNSLVDRTKNFIEDSNLNESVKERWSNWVDDKKQDFDDNIAEGNYASAWADYVTIKAKIADLTLRYRTMLVSAYKNLREKETELRTAVVNKLSALKTVRQKLVAQRLSTASADS